MLDGPAVAEALRRIGATHFVWIPDSELGTWEPALRGVPGLAVVRVSREGEAVGVAAGLLLGGARPVVAMQCTGLFEAGDALRNAVHDLKLPLLLVVGMRGEKAARRGPTADTCPRFTEPVMAAWDIPYRVLDDGAGAADLVQAFEETQASGQARALLLPE